MRAVVYEGFGEPISVAEVEDPRPATDGAVIRVEATGLCRSDWHGWMGHDPDITASRTCRGTSSPAPSRPSAARCGGCVRATA